jgi:hypothetical protein
VAMVGHPPRWVVSGEWSWPKQVSSSARAARTADGEARGASPRSTGRCPLGLAYPRIADTCGQFSAESSGDRVHTSGVSVSRMRICWLLSRVNGRGPWSRVGREHGAASVGYSSDGAQSRKGHGPRVLRQRPMTLVWHVWSEPNSQAEANPRWAAPRLPSSARRGR